MQIDKSNKFLIGLTGNIASGKTLAMNMFDNNLFYKIDSDRIADTQLMQNREVYEFLTETFGGDILDNDHRIDRKRLSQLAFSDRNLMKRLEGIIHPLVFKEVEEGLRRTDKKYAIIESAILFESGLEQVFDRIITVFAPEEIRVRRLMKRAKIDYDEAMKKVRFQMSEFIKISRSDYAIDNSKGIAWLKRQVKNVEEDIRTLING